MPNLKFNAEKWKNIVYELYIYSTFALPCAFHISDWYLRLVNISDKLLENGK